jgi:hypothetical protein
MHAHTYNTQVFLLSVLRTEWLSNATGHGAGTAGAHALTTAPQDIDDFDVEGVMAAAQRSPFPKASQQNISRIQSYSTEIKKAPAAP